MADPEFEKLVQDFAQRSQKAEAEGVANWQEIKTWWIGKAHELYDQIDAWLQSLIKSGSVSSSRPLVQLFEEDLGSYQIESLELKVASRKLTFKPEATLLIGAFGRVEVRGPTGEATLLLLSTGKDAPLKERRDHVAWFIAPPISKSRTSRTRPDLRPLTQTSFELLFADLFGIGR